MHHEHRGAGINTLFQRGAYLNVNGLGVIIADPGFEQVTKNIKRLSLALLALQELEETSDGSWPGRVKMEV
jgi:hypothetical protein